MGTRGDRMWSIVESVFSRGYVQPVAEGHTGDTSLLAKFEPRNAKNLRGPTARRSFTKSGKIICLLHVIDTGTRFCRFARSIEGPKLDREGSGGNPCGHHIRY